MASSACVSNHKNGVTLDSGISRLLFGGPRSAVTVGRGLISRPHYHVERGRPGSTGDVRFFVRALMHALMSDITLRPSTSWPACACNQQHSILSRHQRVCTFSQ